jgi:predicted alpha/beta hydrolase
VTRHYYWRQLRDMKGAVEVEQTRPTGLGLYAQICGWTLARAHARSGDPVALAEYLGDEDTFEKAMVDFSVRYADRNEQDYQLFLDAVHSGRLAATEGV